MLIGLACKSNTTSIVAVSGRPVVRKTTDRTPPDASSAERPRDRCSIAAHAGPMPPTSVRPRRAGSGVSIKITPDRCDVILRAAARAVMNCGLGAIPSSDPAIMAAVSWAPPTHRPTAGTISRLGFARPVSRKQKCRGETFASCVRGRADSSAELSASTEAADRSKRARRRRFGTKACPLSTGPASPQLPGR